jgi:hypothetical protein
LASEFASLVCRTPSVRSRPCHQSSSRTYPPRTSGGGAARTAHQTLPPDTSYRELRHYIDERGRARVEIEIELDDDLAAYLDTVPDRNAFVDEAVHRLANTSTLGRHRYYQRLSSAAAEFGLRAAEGPDLEAWMDHHPEAPEQLAADILAGHAAWLSGRPQPQAPARTRPDAGDASTGGVQP